MSYPHYSGECDRYHDLVRDFGAARPPIVVLCGSTRFYEAFQQANYDCTMAGQIVLSVGFYPHATAEHGHGEGVGHDSAEKAMLDELHLRKIDLADVVYVLNVGGYIGESTRREIGYALSRGKPVEFLERICDNTSVGGIAVHQDRLLVIERADGRGIAPPAGHAVEHGTSFEGALEAEVGEETGLQVVHAEPLTRLTGWRGNRCGRHPGLDGVGHHWEFFTMTVTGVIEPEFREARRVWWADRQELAWLAQRTLDWGRGAVTGAEFAADPGIEPVWMDVLAYLGLIPEVSIEDMNLIHRVAAARTGVVE